MTFIVLNKFGINSGIALIENLFLNSIKRQEVCMTPIGYLPFSDMKRSQSGDTLPVLQ